MKIRPILVLLLIVLLCAVSCTKSETPSVNTGSRPLRSAEKALLSSSNQFCFDYFALLSQQTPAQNIMFSPFSANAALSMLIHGADGETKQQIKNALRIASLSDDSIKSSFKSLKEYLLQTDNSVTLNIANSVWARKELTVAPDFKATLSNFYQADISSLDFIDPQSVNTINGWVSRQTNNKIPTIIDKISPDAVMFLINAVYFNADWKTKFDPTLTRKSLFTKDDQSTITVDMMQNDKMEGYAMNTNEFQFVDLPFGKGAYSFSILMPHGNVTLDQFAAGFNSAKWDALPKGYPSALIYIDNHIKLKMPRFEFDFETLMNDNLQALGMKRAFADGAELSNLFVEKLPLVVSKVKQKSYIRIYEDGGEAAAVTSIEVGVTAVPVNPVQYIEINRPFLFVIRECSSNTILFIGKVHAPEFKVKA